MENDHPSESHPRNTRPDPSTWVPTLEPQFGPSKPPRIRHRRLPLLLTAFYVFTLVFPWSLTCILNKRPLSAPSYFDAHGLLPADLKNIKQTERAINIVNAVASVVTIPLISTLLAQAAVVFVQKHEEAGLDAKHIFALADKGWSNIPVLYQTLRSKQPHPKAFKIFLFSGTALFVIAAAQVPLYQILVPYKPITVATCSDTEYMHTAWKFYGTYSCMKEMNSGSRIGQFVSQEVVGRDIEPGDLAYIKHSAVLPTLISDLRSVSKENPSQLWQEKTVQRPSWGFVNNTGNTFFAAGLQTNSTTGVLRQHIMRLNSTVSCEKISRSEFPEKCGGVRSFNTSYYSNMNHTVRVCVPGEFGTFPWTISRDRQDIREELFLDILDKRNESIPDIDTTLHCTGSTTRGYFELGNYRNNYMYQPLLEKWPSENEMVTSFNDLRQMEGLDYIPKASDDTSIYYPKFIRPTSGPMMTSVIALFGNTSWFKNATEYINNVTLSDDDSTFELCKDLPFMQLEDIDCQQPINHTALANHTRIFIDRLDSGAESLLAMTMFLANRALLNWKTSQMSLYDRVTRVIYTAPGIVIQKPNVEFLGLFILNALTALQLVGLAIILRWIYSMKTWTRALDAESLIQVMKEWEGKGFGVKNVKE